MKYARGRGKSKKVKELKTKLNQKKLRIVVFFYTRELECIFRVF